MQRNAPPGGAGSPSADAVSKYQSKRQSLAPIVIASWGVVAILLVAAGVLMYLLRQRTLAD
ncbi:MAG TPA: hypothetical protein VFV87_16930, partial [Pirellulaceae bacterium]|nr:hypothetical protein [Pirellulaceae bacterium]